MVPFGNLPEQGGVVGGEGHAEKRISATVVQ
jgi:hypothetical protein